MDHIAIWNWPIKAKVVCNESRIRAYNKRTITTLSRRLKWKLSKSKTPSPAQAMEPKAPTQHLCPVTPVNPHSHPDEVLSRVQSDVQKPLRSFGESDSKPNVLNGLRKPRDWIRNNIFWKSWERTVELSSITSGSSWNRFIRTQPSPPVRCKSSTNFSSMFSIASRDRPEFWHDWTDAQQSAVGKFTAL